MSVPLFVSPIKSLFPAIVGELRENDPAIPVYSETFLLQTATPVLASMRNRFPPQSGTYTALPSTVGVAETSPPVVKIHFTANWFTLLGERMCSADEL